MGLFDYVKGEFECPACGHIQTEFQTKSSPCTMDSYDFRDMDYFYAPCQGCGAWIEVELEEELQDEIYDKMTQMRRALTAEDYVVSIREDHSGEAEEEGLEETEN
jgi:transcription elongation factor Elf1